MYMVYLDALQFVLFASVLSLHRYLDVILLHEIPIPESEALNQQYSEDSAFL